MERCDRGGDLPTQVLDFQGYHSRIPKGTTVHSSQDATDYVLAFLEEGGDFSRERALRILPYLLSLQDGNPCSPTFGVWPWFFEVSLGQMSPPDWNWADFTGIR